MAGRIFVNYRRDDERAMAARVRDRLAQRFGASNVFMDVDNLTAGQRFDVELERALAQTDLFIAIIGPKWMELLSLRQQRGEHDFVQQEIAGALRRTITVIPVLIETADLPRSDALPQEIRDLVLHQKHHIAHEHFGRDVAALIDAIRIARRSKMALRPRMAMAAVVLAAAIGGAAVGAWQLGYLPPETQTVLRTSHAEPPNAAAVRKEDQRDVASKRIASQGMDTVKASPEPRQSEENAAAEQAAERRRVEEIERQRVADLARQREEQVKEEQARIARRMAEEIGAGNRELVQEAQERLYELNYDPGKRDGNVSSAFEQSIREFQTRLAEAPTGKLTHGLLTKLRATATLRPWAAIVFATSTQKWGMSWQHERRAVAITAAQSSCKPTPSVCETALTFFGAQCGAFAYSGSRWSLVARDSMSEAHAGALGECQKNGDRCRIVAAVCADGRDRFAE